jgi:acetyl-CoA carboxylase biotin carboxyl carrier protein
MDFDFKELKKLISLMNENGLMEIELSEEGRRCVLKKSPPAVSYAPMAHLPFEPHAMNGGAHPAASMPTLPPPKAAPAAPSLMDGAVTFNSPIVGTFYRSASPGADPFVKVGDKITAETVLCLIEAMKVFNEIKAEMTGTVVEVLVENQEAVEFNQPLFLIKP